MEEKMLIERYEKNIDQKIQQKLIPNKTEEQILGQEFKYYDLQGTGYCNLRDFIRSNERIGVVMNRMGDYERIFNYYDRQNTGLLNYKKLAAEIYQNLKRRREGNNYYESQRSFENTIHYILLSKGGNIPLLHFIKELQMIDYNNSKKMSIDEFIRLTNELQFGLTPNDFQILFQTFDLFSNGTFFYEVLIQKLLSKYWNQAREQIAEDLYNKLTNNGQRRIRFNDIKDALSRGGVRMSNLERKFDKFIDLFKLIIRTMDNDGSVSYGYIISLVKYFGYGIDNDFDLAKFFLKLEDSSNRGRRDDYEQEEEQNGYDDEEYPKYNDDRRENNNLNLRAGNRRREDEKRKGPNEQNDEGNVYETVLKELGIFNRKMLFNFIRHFKYYDNNTFIITKYDFLKVFQDYNIKVSLSSIEKLFKDEAVDPQKTKINFAEFLCNLTGMVLTQRKADAIEKICKDIYGFAMAQGKQKIDINFLKLHYYGRKNIIIDDETANKSDYAEALEIFHYNYKLLRHDDVSKDEFSEFNEFLSLLVPNDEEYISMITNEWQNCQAPEEANPPPKKLWEIEQEKRKNMEENQGPRRPRNLRGKNGPSNEYEEKPVNEDLKEDLRQNEENIPELRRQRRRIKEDLRPNEENIPERRNIRRDDDGYRENRRERRRREKSPSGEEEQPQRNKTRPERREVRMTSGDPLDKLKNKLIQRGIRGLLYLHRQFLLSVPNLSEIKFEDFIHVLELQHILLKEDEYKNIFDKFQQGNVLDFTSFIRHFKKELNDAKVGIVEEAFRSLDVNQTEKIDIDYIKLNYTADAHPEVRSGRKTEEEKILEFLDCFEINYCLLTGEEGNNSAEGQVEFELFANFYEYVAFIYQNDEQFIDVVRSTWKI